MPDDPFSPILDELADLLKMIEQNTGKSLQGPVDSGIEKQLNLLEDAVNKFEEIADEEIAREGKDSAGAYEKLEKSPAIYSDAEKHLIRRCRDLGVNAFVLRVGLLRAARGPKFSKQRETGKNTKKTIQKRRNKFKGVDGDSGWKRL